jgi:ABC-type branched-subunit amino acid transport system ATPase component
MIVMVLFGGKGTVWGPVLGAVAPVRVPGDRVGEISSTGQQKLVEFVRVLMTDPALILLDEPAAGVNRTLLNDPLEAVRRLRDQGKTVRLVEHERVIEAYFGR